MIYVYITMHTDALYPHILTYPHTPMPAHPHTYILHTCIPARPHTSIPTQPRTHIPAHPHTRTPAYRYLHPRVTSAGACVRACVRGGLFLRGPCMWQGCALRGRAERPVCRRRTAVCMATAGQKGEGGGEVEWGGRWRRVYHEAVNWFPGVGRGVGGRCIATVGGLRSLAPPCPRHWDGSPGPGFPRCESWNIAPNTLAALFLGLWLKHPSLTASFRRRRSGYPAAAVAGTHQLRPERVRVPCQPTSPHTSSASIKGSCSY